MQVMCINIAAKVFASMNAHPVQKSIGTSVAVIGFLFGACISNSLPSQARMHCAASDATASGPAVKRTTTNFAIAHYRFDVVPCADEEQDRRVTDSKTNAQLAKDAAALIDWIIAKTGWTAHEAPPIRFIPYAELVKMFIGDKPTDFHVEGLYSDKDHSIYLLDGWLADNLRDRSILLHELVHHLQYLNHAKAACAYEHEFQALDLQIAWLREQGVEDPLDLIGINPSFILMLRQCGE